MKRTDTHRPAVIDPSEYEFVAQEFLKIEGLGACLWLQEMRRRIQEHMKRTGGTYSAHVHGGNCMVCGSVNAIYTSLFYHAKTNSYVRMGTDCTDRIYGQDFGAGEFRRKVEDWREGVAGKRKAQALLADWNLTRCWDLYTEGIRELPNKYSWEELTIRDIVGKLVKYGSISEKQQAFLHTLLQKVDNKPQIEAQREAERQAKRESAKPCPTGRVTVKGTVISTKMVHTDYSPMGGTLKMLVESEEGYRVFVTVPSSVQNVERGSHVEFTATVTPSRDDNKFGFAKRPKMI